MSDTMDIMRARSAARTTAGHPIASAGNSANIVRRARDHRIDWLRGLALVMIFVNHMPGNRFEYWTSRNFGFSDSAEVFVLLAGIAAAVAFFPRFAERQFASAVAKIFRRTKVLYGAHLASTLAAVALFLGYAALTGDRAFFSAIGLTPLLETPLAGLAELATGFHQIDYFNILPLYVALMLVLPALLWLAVCDLRLMVAASFGLYLVGQLVVGLPVDPLAHGWFFNPLDWQFLYAIGIALGVLMVRGEAIAWHPLAGTAAAIYVTYALAWKLGVGAEQVGLGFLPEWADTLAKSTLPPVRLLHVLALGYLLAHSPLWPALKRLPASNPLTQLGRNALPVFVLGSILSMIGALALRQAGQNIVLEITLIVVGVGLMMALARGLETQAHRSIASACGHRRSLASGSTIVAA